ncbi:MAG: hypothetical protein AB7P02_05135 [Alphaproteobacteria bacterium]
MTDFQSSPENQAAITALADGLRALPVGGVLTYSAAHDAVGQDVKTKRRYLLDRAREIVEREDGTRFGTVSNVGVKRLETADVLGIGAGYRRHIRRTATKAHKRLSGLRVNDLTEAQQKRLDAERAGFGAISLLATERAVKTVEAASNGATLPVGKTLALFTQETS